MAEIAEDMQEGLLALAVGAGLQVMGTLMEADVAALCGPRGRHDPERRAVRHGRERGYQNSPSADRGSNSSCVARAAPEGRSCSPAQGRDLRLKPAVRTEPVTGRWVRQRVERIRAGDVEQQLDGAGCAGPEPGLAQGPGTLGLESGIGSDLRDDGRAPDSVVIAHE